MRLLRDFVYAAMLAFIILFIVYIWYSIAVAVGVDISILRPLLGALIVYVIALFAAVFIYIRKR